MTRNGDIPDLPKAPGAAPEMGTFSVSPQPSCRSQAKLHGKCPRFRSAGQPGHEGVESGAVAAAGRAATADDVGQLRGGTLEVVVDHDVVGFAVLFSEPAGSEEPFGPIVPL